MVFENLGAVSYTHLDVYKRQGYECVKRGDSDCFAAQGVVAAHVAGEDFHGALADGCLLYTSDQFTACKG